MLFIDLKNYPLRTLDGLGELARKYKKSVHVAGPLLTWVRVTEETTSRRIPSGPVVPLVALALGMLRLAQHAFDTAPGDVTFAEYVYSQIDKESVSPVQEEKDAVMADIRKQAVKALGLSRVGVGSRDKKKAPYRPV